MKETLQPLPTAENYAKDQFEAFQGNDRITTQPRAVRLHAINLAFAEALRVPENQFDEVYANALERYTDELTKEFRHLARG